MKEQTKKYIKEDQLEKEYHQIGIGAIAAASCVKKHYEQKHVDYDPHPENY
nr:hypothetical protein [uncultured Cohaesibacter sp.]